MVAIVLFFLFVNFAESKEDLRRIKQLVTQWAPLLWMAPDEQFFPSGVDNFFRNVHIADENGQAIMIAINGTYLPHTNTKPLYLVTNNKLDELKKNKSSFLNGLNPKENPVSSYALISPCPRDKNSEKNQENSVFQTFYRNSFAKLFFTVTYWFFYPYNRGKEICFLGKVPAITIFGRCFGRLKYIGSHVGDWEHMTLYFRGNPYPSKMYIGIHDTGGYYSYDIPNGNFKLDGRDNNKRVQKPKLPPVVRIQGGHPVLFAASGSHGLWPTPGEHEYVKIPYLADSCGYGTPWKTWENLEIYDLRNYSLPKWVFFKGRWGNPKTNCILSKKIGLCEHTEGPKGILRPKKEFSCALTVS